MRGRRRLSIPTRVFLGYAVLIASFGAVTTLSLVQHDRTSSTLRLLHQGYLPLALTIGQARADETVLGSLLDRLGEERDTTATRSWLNAARRVRPVTLANAIKGVDQAEALSSPAEDRLLLWAIRSQLEEIRSEYLLVDPDYDGLFQALAAGQDPASIEVLVGLRAHERMVRERLRQVWKRLQDRIATVSAAAADQERQSAYLLGGLTLASLLAGVIVTWWSQRALRPLPELQARVAAVARGDLTRKSGPQADDELGRLAEEFEVMVAAIAARDARLRDAAEAQRRLQRMQEQIVEGLRAAVVVVDGEGVIRTVNTAAKPVLGLPRERCGEPLAGTAVVTHLPALLGAIDAVRGGETREVLGGVAFQDDPQHVINLMVTPFGMQGDVGWTLIVAEDVSDEVKTKARLIHTERLAAIGRMAAHVTHEVRNPLSSIGLNVEMLEEELPAGPSGEEPRRLVRSIQKEIDRLAAITQEYLRLARLPDPQLEEADLGELIRSVVAFVEKDLARSDVKLEVVIESRLPHVSFDGQQLRQALLNLLHNARDAMPEGGVVEVEAKRLEDGVLVAVRDHGRGVPEHERERIFDLFFTTKDRGSGLGLPLTQQIVVAHGGRIRCEANPAGGAVLEMWMPTTAARRTADSVPVAATESGTHVLRAPR